MSEFEVLDPRFGKLIIRHAKLERLWTGARWVEGPAYFQLGAISFSPTSRTTGSCATTRQAAQFRCSESLRATPTATPSISKAGWSPASTRADGSPAPSMTEASSPWRRISKTSGSTRRIVVKSDGSVWFSDPTYGIDGEYEGDAAPSELGQSNIYRL